MRSANGLRERSPERPGSRQAAARAGDPPVGLGVSFDVFLTRDARPQLAARPSAAALTLRRTEGPAVALARPW